MTTKAQAILGLYNLTPAQKRVVKLFMKGLSSKEIGNELCIGEKTVRFHLTEVYRKVNVSDGNRLMVELGKRGWFQENFVTLPLGKGV